MRYFKKNLLNLFTHSTKKCGGQSSSCLQAAMQDKLHSYTCIIHEHISYKLNFDEQQFEHN